MNPMRTFLTDENISIHKEYMKTLRLRHSIIEKSDPELKGKSIYEIEKMRLKKNDRELILSNLSEYLAHDLYFKSFTILPSKSKLIKKYWSSDDAFLYDLFIEGMKMRDGFVFVCIEDRGAPKIQLCPSGIMPKHSPKLAIDVSEHAYFLDYKFEKEKYLKNALSHLDLSLLTSNNAK